MRHRSCAVALVLAAACGACGSSGDTHAHPPAATDAGAIDGAPAATTGFVEVAPHPLDMVQAIWGIGDDLYIAGGRGTVFHSANRGGDWTTTQVEPATSGGYPTPVLESVHGSTPTDVWVAGSGVLLHSGDRGASWQPPPSSPGGEADAVFDVGQGKVFVAGWAYVFRSTDSGGTWMTSALPAGIVYAKAVWASVPGDVYVVGAETDVSVADGGPGDADVLGGPTHGVVLRSADGGATFAAVARTTSDALYRVWGSDDGRVVYAVGSQASAAATADHGATWTTGAQGPSASTELANVWVTPDGTATLVPEIGIGALPTTDWGILVNPDIETGFIAGGVDDLPVDPKIDPSGHLARNAVAVWAPSASEGWAVGIDGALWHFGP